MAPSGKGRGHSSETPQVTEPETRVVLSAWPTCGARSKTPWLRLHIAEPQDVFIPPSTRKLLGDTIKVWVNTKGREILKVDIVKRGIHQFIGTYFGGKLLCNFMIAPWRACLVKAPDVKSQPLLASMPGIKCWRSSKPTTAAPGRLLQDYGPNSA